MSSASSLAPGTRVGPYEVLALLGEGGMGQVYRARDERLSREVAVKVVHAGLAQDAERLRRFEHEAKAAGVLNHPNIVAVYDTGQSDGSPYIVSELLQGETLRDRMATGALGTRKAVEYGVQIARGLAAAHEKGIVHRDLKPENLFLTKDGLVKILDFGIAKLGGPGEERAGDGRRDPGAHRHEPRDDAGNRRLHVPRAGPWPPDRPPLGSLLVRGRALRDAHGQAGIQGHDRGGHVERHLARGPHRGHRPPEQACPPACSASCAAVSRRRPRTASRPRATSPSPSKAPRPPSRVPRLTGAMKRRGWRPIPALARLGRLAGGGRRRLLAGSPFRPSARACLRSSA